MASRSFSPLSPCTIISIIQLPQIPLDKHINIWLYDYMKKVEKIMKLLSDSTRLRILMLLTRRELCVCQIMGVLGVSQPLVSRNLKLLGDAGFLEERKEGKLVFYSMKKKMDALNARLIELLKETLEGDRILSEDAQVTSGLRGVSEKDRKVRYEDFF